KFCILVKYFELYGAFTDDLELRLFVPGDAPDSPSWVQKLPRSSIPSSEMPHPMDGDQERIITLTAPLTIGPFEIKQEGSVKVRMACGSHVTQLGSIYIRTQR